MQQLLLFGLLCVLGPCLVASLHFLLGGFTSTLIYLVALAQALVLPVMMALEPDISFGSDVYSLGAGIGIVLIGAVELIFLAGSGAGLVIALTYVRRRERAKDTARAVEVFSNALTAIPRPQTSGVDVALSYKQGLKLPRRAEIMTPLATQHNRTPVVPRKSTIVSLIGAYLCFILALAGATVLWDGLSSGSFGWVRYFGAVSLIDRPIAFAAVAIMELTATLAVTWGAIALLKGLRRRSARPRTSCSRVKPLVFRSEAASRRLRP